MDASFENKNAQEMNNLVTPIVGEETAVRVILFNKDDKVLLQKVSIPGKPVFYITPGGRLDYPAEPLKEAALRELKEETGFSNFSFSNDEPVFSGSHIMRKSRGNVKMTEHFFVVKLEDQSDQINSDSQSLTEEEKEVHVSQKWFTLSEIQAGGYIIVPVNLHAFSQAHLNGEKMPEIDFSDPPQFSS